MHDFTLVRRVNINLPASNGSPPAWLGEFKAECIEQLKRRLGVPPERIHFVCQVSAELDVSAYFSKSRTDDVAKVLCAKIVFPLHRRFVSETSAS